MKKPPNLNDEAAGLRKRSTMTFSEWKSDVDQCVNMLSDIKENIKTYNDLGPALSGQLQQVFGLADSICHVVITPD
jgi:hypothetical protein